MSLSYSYERREVYHATNRYAVHLDAAGNVTDFGHMSEWDGDTVLVEWYDQDGERIEDRVLVERLEREYTRLLAEER